MTLGNAIKVMRTAAGLKQKKLADMVGVSVNYLSLVENGKREPSLSFLNRLAEALGVPTGMFFLWQEVGERQISQNRLAQIRGLLLRLEAMYLSSGHNRVTRGKRGR